MSLEENMLQIALKCHQQGEIDKAEALYNQILQIAPDNVNALYLLAMLYFQNNNYDKSMPLLMQAVNIQPSPLIYQMLGNIFVSKNEFNNAIICYENALNLDPNFSDVYNNLGYAFFTLGKYDESIVYYKKAVEFEPENHNIFFNIAISYAEMKEYEKAAEYYKKVIEINPSYYAVYNNLGSLYYNQLRNYQKACELFEKAIELNHDNLSDNKIFEYNLSRSYLILGNFEKGWKAFESRLDLFDHHKLKFPENICPKLSPESNIDGKTIYVYSAGGFGDTVQFSRYLPVMNSMGAKVVCRIKPELEKLLSDSKLNVYEYITYDPATPEIPEKNIKFDYQISFMSLPYVFKANSENMPYKNGFLQVAQEKIDFYKENYFQNDNLKVGISWQASEVETPRSMPHLKYLYKLAQIPNIKLYSLQKGHGVNQLNDLPDNIEITDLGKTFNDFSDSAAAIMNLDVVLSIDSALIHIAGALNKPTYALLAYAHDWRWLANSDKSYWYDSVKIYTQNNIGDWNEVADRVYNDLLIFKGH